MEEDYMECEEISLEIALEDLAKIYKWIYFEYFLTEKEPNIINLKISQTKFLNSMFDKINDKYIDHVEASRNDLRMINKD